MSSSQCFEKLKAHCKSRQFENKPIFKKNWVSHPSKTRLQCASVCLRSFNNFLYFHLTNMQLPYLSLLAEFSQMFSPYSSSLHHPTWVYISLLLFSWNLYHQITCKQFLAKLNNKFNIYMHVHICIHASECASMNDKVNWYIAKSSPGQMSGSIN